MSQRYQIKPNTYVHRRIAGEDVLISIGPNIAVHNGFVELNETCAFLFDRMQEPVTVEELADLLCGEYEVERELALEDIGKLIGLMQEHDMVNVYE